MTTEGAGEAEHLLLAARQQTATDVQALLELGEQRQRLVDVDLGDAEVVAGGQALEHRLLLGDVHQPLARPARGAGPW